MEIEDIFKWPSITEVNLPYTLSLKITGLTSYAVQTISLKHFHSEKKVTGVCVPPKTCAKQGPGNKGIQDWG